MERQLATEYGHIPPDHRLRYEFAAEQVKGRILDAACGCGYGSAILKAAVAVDVSLEAIQWGRRFFPGPCYVQGRLEQKPWDGRFDSIVSLETLEHLPSPEVVVRLFYESCNPGAVFIASVPNEKHYPFDPDRFKDDEYPHQRHYTPEEFEELLEPFKVEKMYHQRSKHDPEIREGTEGRFLVARCVLPLG